MDGKIIKGIGGFYYVHVQGEGVFACRARGIFRKEKQRPLVGDNVRIEVTDEKDLEGSVEEIYPRRNALIRPAAANVDQALVVFAAASPAPNLNLLDRFLIQMQREGVPVLICLNKTDLVEDSQAEEIAAAYSGCGCPLLCISVVRRRGLEQVRAALKGKTTIVAGPSGVGKSSLTNHLAPEALMEVGEVSRKADRGRHTTRHTQLIWLEEDTYFLDTPGFSSLDLPAGLAFEQLHRYYPEFAPYEERCYYQGCAHISEPDCAVKAALERGEISRIRYGSYLLLAQELKERRSSRTAPRRQG